MSNAHVVFSGDKNREQEHERMQKELDEYARKAGELTMEVEHALREASKTISTSGYLMQRMLLAAGRCQVPSILDN